MRGSEELIDYRINTDIYEGPLDLLLNLIEKAELDITALSLAKVTDQFLDYIDTHQEISADSISEFLVIAAKLIQIKSEALLPRPPVHEEGEENLGESLAQQLRIYREIKRATQWLQRRVDGKLRTYLHTAEPYTTNVHVDMSNINLDDLINSILSIVTHNEQIASLGTVISIQKITLRRKVQSILNTLQKKQAATFKQMLDQDNSRLNMIVVFLAVLELIKQEYVTTRQEMLFGDFEISATTKIFENNSLDLALED